MALWLERLLTMGEGQGIDYARLAELGAGTGGRRGVVTWEAVHETMSGLPPVQRAILYLRPNPQRIEAKELTSLTTHLWLSLIGYEAKNRHPDEVETAIREDLTTENPKRDLRQARTVLTALAEFEDAKNCKACLGSRNPGKVAETIPGLGLVYTTCKACDGRSWNPWSDNRRARAIGGTRGHWRTRYEPGYLHVSGEISLLHKLGAASFKFRLFSNGQDDTIESRLRARA